jgi:hypothetical protein
LTLRDIWFFMASLIPQIQTSTCPSPPHPVPRCQDSCLLFFDVWFIMVKFLLILLQLPSCLTHHFMSSINSFLKTFFLWSSFFHRYPILRSSTWSILSWLWARHKCWTKLIFLFLLFMCFSCLTLHRLFNMKLFIGWHHILIILFHLLHHCTPRDISMH